MYNDEIKHIFILKLGKIHFFYIGNQDLVQTIRFCCSPTVLFLSVNVCLMFVCL